EGGCPPAEPAEVGAVRFFDEADVLLVNAEPVSEILARRIDVLAVAPERELVTVPLCHAAIRLHRHDAPAAEVIGKLLDDGGFGESFLDVATVPVAAGGPAMCRIPFREPE